MNAIHEPTHEVTNQVPALEGYDVYADDPWLTAAVQRAGAAWIGERASELGRYAGSAEAHHHATLANRYTPELKTHDRIGNRIDFVEYHPSYHVLMKRAMTAGVHSLAWKPAEARFSARAALFHVWNQLEQGTACPVTMTFASIAVLDHMPAALAREWRRKILADAYDPEPRPVSRKTGATIGMAMTEKQAGSDLRAVQTVAERSGDRWRLAGHKWFCSAPMSDAFFTLARTPEGVSCFFVPRTLPGGVRNPFLIQRLKEKVGNRSNASAEIEYRDTEGWLVGEAGRGIATLINMAHHTRFDIVVGVAGMMRAALNQAVHHATHRAAFGKPLVDHALMTHVLADLALEAESATLLAFRLAAAFDRQDDPHERALQRVLTPIAKYWVCKRITAVAAEAMECWGGNGYVEDSPLARLYREAPLNGIWEGSANVICLDVMRALTRSPEALAALAGEIAAAGDPRLDRALRSVEAMLADPSTAEASARRIVERLATCTAAALMLRHGHPEGAEAFCASRLESHGGRSFGTLEVSAHAAREIVDRARLRGR